MRVMARSSVSPKSACFIRASVPVACAADCDVPDRISYPPVRFALVIQAPGALISGLMMPFQGASGGAGPRPLNPATASYVSVAPTASARVSLPGAETPNASGPVFPTLNTGTIPADRHSSSAGAKSRSSADPRLHEQFTAKGASDISPSPSGSAIHCAAESAHDSRIALEASSAFAER